MARIISSRNQKETLELAIEQFQKGACVAIPTETVYGLAADATDGESVAKIFEMKKRPAFNPLICHVDGIEMAKAYGRLDANALKLAEAFWPGPLTLVVPLSEKSKAHDLVTAGLGAIGLRHPKGFSAKIISAFGKPLAAPSANVSGRISATSAQHVAEEFQYSELLIIDDGPCNVGLESTIVKIDGEAITLLRPGAITNEQIEEVLGQSIDLPKSDDGIQAPGMMVSHYAPNAKVKLDCMEPDANATWLGFGENEIGSKTPQLNLSKSANLVEAASNLYAYLKALDTNQVDSICVAPIPHHGLGIAINDRLTRAAAPREQSS